MASTHGASAASQTITLKAADAWEDTSYQPGGYVRMAFDVENPTDTLARDVTLNIKLPAGATLDLDWCCTYEPDNGTFSYDAATRTVKVEPTSSTDENGMLNPYDQWTFWLYIDFDKTLSAPSVTVSSFLTWKDRTGATQTPVAGNNVVYTKAEPYILETTTEFSPATITSGGTSVMTSTITNSGTGGARAIYFYMQIDDRLTVDLSSVPAECDYYPQDTWESWDGRTIVDPQHLSCNYDDVLGPGESESFSVTVTAPVTPGPEEYEGVTELSCTSSAPGAYDATDDGDSAGLLRLGPPTPGELHVVQLGGPKPIKLPTAGAEPLQPTAGGDHSVATYVYNVGTDDISNTVTVVVTIPAGFTPTKISATTDDSGATAPVCTLATRTCVFSQLAGGKQGRISIEGTLATTITNNSKLDVSARASSASISSATDSNSFAVTSLADVRVSIVANGAYVAGLPVAYTLSAANSGPSAAAQPVAKVTLPEGASFDSVPSGCSVSGRTMTCAWTRLNAKEVQTKEFTATYGPAERAFAASAALVFTTSTPLTKDSVTKDSTQQKVQGWAVSRAIKASLVESQLPRTGGNSNTTTYASLVLIASGVALTAVARRRRVL